MKNSDVTLMGLAGLFTVLIGCGEVPADHGAESQWAETPTQTGFAGTGKADRATIDPDEVTSEGSGQHGVETPNRQDHLLHRALYAAAWAAQVRFPQGARHFLHFLENSGKVFQMEVDRLLADNPIEEIDDISTSLQERLDEQLTQVRDEASALIEAANDGAEAVEASWSGEWTQFYATEGNWYWALGGFSYRVIADIDYQPGSPVVITYSVDIQDKYNWDAGKEIELRFDITITDEIFQRLHQVGIAQEFAIEGRSSEMVLEFDYDAVE